MDKGPGEGDDALESVETREDVAGCYQRVTFSEDVMNRMNRIEPWPQPYQWYCFQPDGVLRSMRSTEPGDMSREELEEILEPLPPVQKYYIPRTGYMVTHHRAANETVIWVVSAFRENVKLGPTEFEPGDLVMTIRRTPEGEDIYHRFLKRLD